MGSLKLPPGYLLPEGMTMADVLERDRELLAEEGLDIELLLAADLPAADPEPRVSSSCKEKRQ